MAKHNASKESTVADMDAMLRAAGQKHGKMNMQVQTVIQSQDDLKAVYGNMTDDEVAKMMANSKIIYKPQD